MAAQRTITGSALLTATLLAAVLASGGDGASTQESLTAPTPPS